MTRSLALTVLLAACTEAEKPPAPPPPPIPCRAESAALSADIRRPVACAQDSDCELLSLDGLIGWAPVAAADLPAFKQRGAAWKNRCHPGHTDAIGHMRPACVAGVCASVNASKPGEWQDLDIPKK